MIGIIGDTHWGAGYNMGKIDPRTQLNTRLLDFSNTFNRLIDRFAEHDVKVAFLTGDIFETRHPTAAQLNAFSQCVQRAIGLGIKLVINVGNHDQMRHISTTTVDVFDKLRLPDLKVYQEMGIYELDNSTGIIMMPYRDKRMMEASSNAEAIEMLREELSGYIKQLNNKNIIVIGHYMLEKSPEGFDPDSFSMNELKLPLDMFNGCDMVIMGHIHQPEVISRNKPVIIYAGSMDKVSYGEKDHSKISIIIDENNIPSFKLLKSSVRNLFELNFDYLDDKKPYKDEINNKICLDIDAFNNDCSIKNSITKVSIKVKENDLYYISQPQIKEHVLSKGVHCCTGVQVTSINSRQLRNSMINETLAGKKAFASYLDGIKIESSSLKKKILKYGEEIIDEVEGK